MLAVCELREVASLCVVTVVVIFLWEEELGVLVLVPSFVA
jgi:hypothetical protein